MAIETHQLKVDPEPFNAMWTGSKKATIRDLSDRKIRVGDIVIFRLWNDEIKEYDGSFIKAKITHIQRGYYLPPNCAMLSFEISDQSMYYVF